MSEAATSCPKCGAAIPPEAPQGLCPKCLLKQASFPTETGHTTRHTRPAPPDRDELAAAFPHLQILELIGQGGMGFVYKARQPKLDRLVALKILAQPLAEQTHFAERFTREGRTLAKLNHPNIVTIHDFGQAGPFFYLLMEYVDGVNLRQAMRAGAVNSTQALAIVPRICEALQYAHNEGVLHRDIKPDNILLDTRGRVKIADFGIAKLMAEAVAENPLTGSGASLGTPHYMAPEQIEKPNAVDHRADIYSLGVVFYEMLTGELPLGRFAAPSEKSAVDPRLDDVVFQTLEKQPERRPQSADEVKTRVETISGGPQHAEPSEGQVTFKMSKCYLTTPQFLSSRIGRLLRYTNKGELRLDEETLTFAPRGGNWIVIPLRAITSLSVGDFPAGLGKIKFISVTFTEKGNTHRFFFIPTRGAFRSIWNTNQLVEEWFNAIRHAAKARTGRIPPSFKDDLDPIPSPTSKTSLSSALLKGALTLALIVILGLGVGLGAFIGLYALLRHSTPRPENTAATESPIVLTSNTPPSVVAATGPGRTLENVTVSGTNHVLELHTATEPAAGERFVPVIRYGNGPWGENDGATLRHEYRRGPQGAKHEATFWWNLPSAFNSGYETAAAVLRTRASLAEHPITIYTNFVEPIFDLANPAGQSVFVGLRIEKSPITPPTPPITATLSGFRLQLSGENGRSFLTGGGNPNLPPGYRLQPVAIYNGQELFTKSYNSKTYDPDGQLWNYWSLPPNTSPYIDANAPANQPRTLKITYGEPVTVFSRTNYIAQLELVPLPGITPPPITPKPAEPIQPKTEPTLPPPETLEITLRRRSVEPRRVMMEGDTLLTLDQNITPFVFVSDPSQPTSRRVIRTPESGVPAMPGGPVPFGSSSENNSVWRAVSGATNSQAEEFIWSFGDTFSLERDLIPAVDRFFEKRDYKTIRLTVDQRATLFTITNAFGQVAECGLNFTKNTPTVRFQNAGVIVRSFGGSTNGAQIEAWFDVAFPEGLAIQASGAMDNAPSAAVTTRTLESNRAGSIQCRWSYPEGFLPPRPAAETNQARKSTVPMPQPAPPLNPIFERLSQSVRSGDARVTSSEPLEIFAITNSDGKIFRGKLEISYGRGVAPHPVSASMTGPTKDVPLHFKALLSQNTLLFETPVDLALNEGIRTMVRYNDGKWDSNDRSSEYRVEGGSPVSRRLRLTWPLPETFSFPFDIKPVLDNVLTDNKTTSVRLSTNEIFELFSVTNALKQKISCGLQYTRLASASSDLATITNILLQVEPFRIRFSVNGVAPADTHLQPVVIADTNQWFGTSVNRSDFGNLEIGFGIPTEFRIQHSTPIPHPTVLEIKRGERAELFSLTNAANKIYRAYLEIAPVSGISSRTNLSLATERKTFEFTSVTNSDDYIVLQSETPLEVGKNLVALIEDSAGKTNRSVSGTTVRHTASETHTATQLMWKMPDGSPTNWMQNTIQKLREQIIAKPIQLSEGETIRLFDLRSTPGFVQQFAAIRYESVRPADGQNSATVRVRSASASNAGLFLFFDADVPPGYRLEAVSDSDKNGDEARLNCSNIRGKNNYDALWSFDNLRGQNLTDLREALTNRVTRLIPETFVIVAGNPRPILTFKTTSGDEFPALLKLSPPQ